MTNKLIPGKSAYMEEDVVVSDEPVIINNDETVESDIDITKVTEINHLTNEAVENAAEAEMIFRRYDEMERLQKYIKRHGVSREFMVLHNTDGYLSDTLKLNIPSLENIPLRGDPHSALSIACMEGFGDALKEAWAWVKKICGKLLKFISRIFEAVTYNFRSLDSNIGRLRKAIKSRQPDDSALEKYEGSWVPLDKLAEYEQEIKKKEDAVKNLFGNYEAAKREIARLVNNLQKNLSVSDKDATDAKDGHEYLNEIEKDLAKDKDIGKLPGRPSQSTQKFPAGFSPDGVLDQVANAKALVDQDQARLRIQQDIVKQVIVISEKADTRSGGVKDSASSARKIANLINRANAITVKFVNERLWIMNRRVRIVSIYVVNCMRGEDQPAED